MPKMLPFSKTSKIGGHSRVGSFEASSKSKIEMDPQVKLDINEIKLTIEEPALMQNKGKKMSGSFGESNMPVTPK